MATMTRKLIAAAAGVVLVLAAGGEILAHHAFSAEFDADRPVTLKGTIVKLELVNPHAWIHIEVPKEGGGTEVWMIEGGTPNTSDCAAGCRRTRWRSAPK